MIVCEKCAGFSFLSLVDIWAVWWLLIALGFSVLNEEVNVCVEVSHKRLLTGNSNSLSPFIFSEVLYCCASFFGKRNVVLCCSL